MHSLEEKLKDYHIILGSASPRRKELLAGLNIPFEIRVKNTSEIVDKNLSSEKISQSIAEQKFNAFLPDLKSTDFLITADTLVYCENQIIAKPKSLSEAEKMIGFLSGKTHHVITGVCFGTKQRHCSFAEKTMVTFSEISERDIKYYVEHYKPLDKAGAYGVQEWIGYIGIEKIEGSYYNVMGLPVKKLYSNILKYEI